MQTSSTTHLSRGTPQITFYRDATLQVSYGIEYDLGLRVTSVNDRSALPFAGNTIDTGALSGPFMGAQ